MNLKQNGDSIDVYYTKLKSLSEELNQFRPACYCSKCDCGGIKKICVYFQSEHNEFSHGA